MRTPLPVLSMPLNMRVYLYWKYFIGQSAQLKEKPRVRQKVAIEEGFPLGPMKMPSESHLW